MFAFGYACFTQGPVDGVRKFQCVFARYIAREYGELIAAETRNDVLVTHLGFQQLGGTNQQLVARGMPIHVVNLLEFVEIDKIHCALDSVTRDAFDFFLQHTREITAVHKPGQRIAFRHFSQSLVPFFNSADGGIQRIADDGDFSVFCAHDFDIGFSLGETGQRHLQFRQGRERLADHAPPENQREQEQRRDEQAARCHAAHQLVLVVTEINTQIDIADDLLVFRAFTVQAEVE